MAIFALGDLHLSFGADKKMDIFGGQWENYTQKIYDNWVKTISDGDTVILCGDTSWGMNLDEAVHDFKFLESLPGKKILVKGNHDYWWNTVTKMKNVLQQNNIASIDFLHNNAFLIENIAVCGTRGWFYGEAESSLEDAKIINREIERLKTSIEKAKALNASDIVCFLHYPPIYSGGVCKEIFEILKRYEIPRCYYGHIHSAGVKYAVTGAVDGIDFQLISCDSIGFIPQRIYPKQQMEG